MELRETQSSWEDVDNIQRAGGEAACAVGGSQCQSLEVSVDTQETNIAEPSTQLELPEVQLTPIELPVVEQPQVEEPPTRRPLPPRSSRPIGGRMNETMERFSTLMAKLDQKLDTLETEESGFGCMVAGMLKKVPQDRKNAVKKSIMDILEANIQSAPATEQSSIFVHPPPPSGPYYNFPNPTPPRTHHYYPPRFRPYTDEYGNTQNLGNPPIPYPSPSPIPSTLTSQRFSEESILMPPTPSPRPSTSSTQPTYHQL
ncbi:uncharacterized protein [Aquarana catesbeiana]|uniref:uncharacterized protein n=1 Tax=Aquarana catesbeiana TaxID=8400 RepID=UPI003CC98B64